MEGVLGIIGVFDWRIWCCTRNCVGDLCLSA